MVVGSMAVIRVWNLRGVMVVDGGCAGGGVWYLVVVVWRRTRMES